MWDVEAITKAALAIGTPLATLAGFGGRKRRLRSEIRDNLALAEQIEKSDAMQNFGFVTGWLHGRVALDVAKLTGQEVGTSKKPIPWGSIVTAAVLAAAFGYWAYRINLHGFVWYSVFPGIVGVLFAISIASMVTNREQSPEEQGPLPPGAVAAPTRTASERIATAFALAAGSGDERLAPGMQADVVLRFAKLLQLGAFESALTLADENWLLCRMQAWLWNNRDHFGPEVENLEALLAEILDEGIEHAVWKDFAASEAHQFAEAWAGIDFDTYGVASRRRRMARDLDLVILAPTGGSGGYFVMTATAIPDAMTFLVRSTDEGWRVANHAGVAPPSPGWPPSWWITDDPALTGLPEAYAPLAPDDDEPDLQDAPAS